MVVFLLFCQKNIKYEKKKTFSQKLLALVCPMISVLDETFVRNYNNYSRKWMNERRPILTVLILIGGGLYNVLAFSTAGFFGSNLLNNGITKIELQDFAGIKIITTVIFEVFFLFFVLALTFFLCVLFIKCVICMRCVCVCFIFFFFLKECPTNSDSSCLFSKCV